MEYNERHFQVKIAGKQLLMHNGQLADPLNEHTKALREITGKRKKSDEDHIKLAELEFQGGLYFDDQLGPYIPGHVIDATIKNGAKKKKLGTIFESCVTTSDPVGYALQYKGPRTREALWKDPRFRDRRGCGVQTSRVIRTRPKFTDWSLEFDVQVFPCELNPSDIQQAIIDAGIYVGVGDFRPRFGLFTLVEFDETTKADAA
jgi:hypothetical protein